MLLCVIARYNNADCITYRVMFELLWQSRYLIRTRDPARTLWRIPPAVELEAFCDTSLGDGIEGCSFSASMALFPGSRTL